MSILSFGLGLSGGGGETIFVTKLVAKLETSKVTGTIITPPVIEGTIKNIIVGSVTTKKTTGQISSSKINGEL